MKPRSRGDRGKKVRKSTSVGRGMKKINAVKNPLESDERQLASTKVELRGASLFLGFTLKF